MGPIHIATMLYKREKRWHFFDEWAILSVEKAQIPSHTSTKLLLAMFFPRVLMTLICTKLGWKGKSIKMKMVLLISKPLLSLGPTAKSTYRFIQESTSNAHEKHLSPTIIFTHHIMRPIIFFPLQESIRSNTLLSPCIKRVSL